jgi:hypothetical protein
MTIERKVKRPLTEDEMSVVLASVQQAETLTGIVVEPMIAIFSALLLDIGQTWETCQMLDPRDFAIPEKQITTILTAVQARCKAMYPGPDPAISVMMEWVNRGPSSYTEDTDG